VAEETTTTTEAEPERASLPDRVTMPLLTLVTREAIDQDYIHAAQRRAAAGDAAGGGTPRGTGLRGAAVATAVFGLLIALAAVQTARNADVQEASRDALIERIDERKAEVASLGERIDALQKQNAGLRSTQARVRGQLADATVDLRTLELSTGFAQATGPGLRITVSDNPDGSPDGRVRATDLRRLVNGMWRAGAEAIAINGRRLSALSAIAQSNIAIQVNRGPLTPPYVVSAIGDPGLGSRLDATATGLQFQALADQFGFVVDRHDESELQLPSAPDNLRRLRYVEQGGGPPDNQEDVP
jgi:uncharacterized protein YlxW (UPF0749 family)